MNKPFIIGINGKARSGKDEFAKVLSKTYGLHKISFAKKLKEFCVEYFGFTEDQMINKNKESRSFLQGLGQCLREQTTDEIRQNPQQTACTYFDFTKEEFDNKRKRKPNEFIEKLLSFLEKKEKEISSMYPKEYIWVNYLKSFIQKDSSNLYVISDVRYENEKEFVEENGICIQIERVDKPDIESGEEHVSETNLDHITNWYKVITNERKTDWQERLEQAASNLLRRLIFEDKIKIEDLNSKINLRIEK